ncbi:MAG: rRNA methyltransferase [Anaerolineales bacterium]|nr:MAG: rRNA methyltransferase [Anaerolineales bacterium]
MPYRYAIEKTDYSDFASGCVFYGAPGHPAFPIRLASEIYQACLALRVKGGLTSRCVLYDPVCGGAYHLSVLAYLHWETIHSVIGSDVDKEIIATAERNIGLLTLEGVETRIQKIEGLFHAYGKQSHKSALASALRLRDQLLTHTRYHTINQAVFCADALDATALQNHLGDVTADIVFADIPYGMHSRWQIADTSIQYPITHMLSSLLPVLAEGGIVAVAADKSAQVTHPLYMRVERFQSGKRQVILLKPGQ